MKPRDKSMPILRYRRANPDATFDEIAQKFGRTRNAIYSLMYKHKLINLPPEPERQIIEDPFDIGHEIPVIEQKKIDFEEFKIKHPEEVYSKPELVRDQQVSRGQEVLREEIERLNAEIANMQILDEINQEMLEDALTQVEQLKNDNIGLRAVLAYLEAKIHGTAV